MVNNVIRFIVDISGNILEQQGEFRANNNASNKVQFVSPFPIDDGVSVTFTKPSHADKVTYLMATSYKGADVVEDTNSLYQDVAEWNVWEKSLEEVNDQYILAWISKWRNTDIKLSFNVGEITPNAKCLDFKGYFGVDTDLPTEDQTTGDYYACEDYKFTIADNGNGRTLVFGKGMYVYWTGSYWNKVALKVSVNTPSTTVPVDANAGQGAEIDDDEAEAIEITNGNVAINAENIQVNADAIQDNVEDIGALDVRVTQNEADIVNNDVDILALQGRVTQNENDIDANETAIGNNELDIADNLVKITALETANMIKSITRTGSNLFTITYYDDTTSSLLTLAELKAFIGEATQSLSGLMSAQDKTDLDTLMALFDNDGDSVVNTIQEILDIFQNYPEGVDLVNALAGKVDKTTTVNGHDLSSDVIITADEIELSDERNLETVVLENASDIDDLESSIYVTIEDLDLLNYGINIFNPNTVTNGYYISTATGLPVSNALFSYSSYIKVKPLTLYKTNVSSNVFVTYFTKNKTYISGIANTSNSQFTTPSNAYYITLSIPTTNVQSCMLVLGSYVQKNYDEFKYILQDNIKIPEYNVIENHNIIIVDYAGSGDYTTITSALASISNSDENNIYDIYIKDGTYEEYDLIIPNYVNLIGFSGIKENVIIQGELPETATDGEISFASTLVLKYSHKLEHLTITAKNMRYPIHSESSGVEKDWKQIVNDCYIEHYGNQEVIDYRIANSLSYSGVWSAIYAWGEGASSGAYAEFNESTFKSTLIAWYVHEASNQTKPYVHILNNCKLITPTAHSIGVSSSTNLPLTNKVIINNCYLNGSVYVYGDYTTEIIIGGSGIPLVQVSPSSYQFVQGHYPIITGYTKEYYNNGVTLNGGEIVYFNGHRKIAVATSLTSKEIMAGFVIGSANVGDLVTVVSNGYYYLNGSVLGTKYKVDAGALIPITLETDIVVGIGIGNNFIKMFI
jgi:hypothetical protein